MACGDDYSAVVSYSGEVYVCGNMDNGKLGMGKEWR